MRLLTNDRIPVRGGMFWLNRTNPLIPLGRFFNARKGSWDIAHMPYPERNGVGISDTWLITGGTDTGKSVQSKVIEFFLAKKRPIIDLDWAGQDSHLLKFPNSQPENLPPHTAPDGIKAHYLFFPNTAARPKRVYERTIKPNLGKYNAVQLEALGFGPGAAMYLQNILRRYGRFRNMRTLLQFIENFPINDQVSRRTIKRIKMGTLKLMHHRCYAPNDTLNTQSRDSIKKILPGLITKDSFRLDNQQEFDFGPVYRNACPTCRGFLVAGRCENKSCRAAGPVKNPMKRMWKKGAFLSGESMVFSFNDKEVGRIEINWIMDKAIELRRKYPNCPRPVLKIEEAHKVLGQEGKKIDEVIEDFVLVARKASLGLMLVMPEVIELSDRIIGEMKHIITGTMSYANAFKLAKAMTIKRIDEFTGYIIIEQVNPYKIMGLEADYITNRREFIYWSKRQKKYCKYQPFNSPAEIHREVLYHRQEEAMIT